MNREEINAALKMLSTDTRARLDQLFAQGFYVLGPLWLAHGAGLSDADYALLRSMGIKPE